MRWLAGLLSLAVVGLVVAAGCGGGEGVLGRAPEVEVSPLARPTPVLPESAGPTPATGPSPTPAPTVSLPEVESLEFLTADVEVPGLPASFAASRPDRGLETLVRVTLSGYEGEYSVVVRNLADGRSAALNEGRVYYAASLFKLALLLEAYRQRDGGEIDFAEMLTLDEEYAQYDFGTLEYLELEVGDMLSVADALKAMIIVSDTPTAVMIQDVVNPARVDQTLAALGIDDMSVTSYELPTTARDVALLMEAVAAGAGVTGESRREMLALLLQEWVTDGIPSGVPNGSAVAHKTGNFTGATHDVALVWGPAGPYILAVLSDRSWDSEPIAAVSRAVWGYFASHP